jgi:hypothetical protein
MAMRPYNLGLPLSADQSQNSPLRNRNSDIAAQKTPLANLARSE